jgi:hypothetical protein
LIEYLPWPFLATLLSAAAAPVMVLLRGRSRRVGRQRNATDQCAHCGAAWVSSDGTREAHLVEGQLVCSLCAPRLRRRTIGALLAFVGLGGAMFVAGWGPLIGIFEQFGIWRGIVGMNWVGWIMFGLPPLVVAAWADWSLRTMRRDNTLALVALARARLMTTSAPSPTPLPARVDVADA